MSLVMDEKTVGNVLEVHVTGKLRREDYERFTPEVERLIGQHGKVRILFDMHDFHGWEPAAAWEDLKFDGRHFRDIERVAFVGETTWQKMMSVVCRPLTTAKLRFFERSQEAEARAWLAAP